MEEFKCISKISNVKKTFSKEQLPIFVPKNPHD